MIYFCAKNRKRTETEDADEDEEESKGEADDEAETPEARAKRVQEKVNQGKIEVAPAKHERELGNELGSLQ